MKLVQFSPAMAGFSFNNINIFQHIKHLFNANVIVPVVPDGMNTVGWCNNIYIYNEVV